MSGPELKPCPFCGGEARLFIGMVAFDDYEVQCAKCGFSGPNFGASDEPDARDDAINHWNTRAPVEYAALPEVQAMIAGAFEAAANNIEDYPRVAPDRTEAQHYDEQIEHAQAIIRALIPADAVAARDAMIAEAAAKERGELADKAVDRAEYLEDAAKWGGSKQYLASIKGGAIELRQHAAAIRKRGNV